MSDKKNNSLAALYGRNVKNENDGVWVALKGGIEVKLRSINYEPYQTLVERLKAPHRRTTRADTTLPEKVLREIIAKAISAEILVDWKGISDDAGEIKFTPAKAYEILVDPVYAAFLDDVVFAAGQRETFLEDAAFLEDTEKNSGKSSAGI